MNRRLPWWLKRLDRVKAEFRATRWPATAEQGMRQVLLLAGQGWDQLISDLKAERPHASVHQIEDAAHRLLRRWDDARLSLTVHQSSRKG